LWLGSKRCQALDLIQDRNRHGLGSRERVLVGEADDLDADGRQRGVALSIALQANFVAVLGAVDLDGELNARTKEVECVGACGPLAPELDSEVAIPGHEPDSGFRVGRAGPLEAAEVDRR
jgi:hypothetical protein